MKKLTVLIICILSVLGGNIYGRSNREEGTTTSKFITVEDDSSVTYIDKFGLETKITKEPKKVIIAYNSILGLWYFSGGKSLTKVKGSTNVPPEAMDLIDLGSSQSLSLEAIVALEPELVILAGNYESQTSLAPHLNDMGIETMIIDTSLNPYERFKENAFLFSKINNTQDLYENKISPIISQVNEIINKTVSIKNKPKVAAIFATSKSLSLDSDIALTGEMVKLLGGDNILKSGDLIASGESRITFSIEALITQNPDIIMFSTMGSIESAKKNIKKMISENPVWQEVEAVKNDRVYFLPKEFSVYKPNELYGDAFLYIANLMYPDVFEKTNPETSK